MEKMHLVFAFILISVVLLSGCLNMSPEALALANPLVKQFMSQYPNAKITVTHFTANQSTQIIDNISAECGNPYMTPKEFYRINIDDPDSGLKVIAWVDWETKQIECAVKYGGGGNKTISKPGEPIRECKSHAEAKCYGGHVYWFDSCGHVQEKKEYCTNGCENGFCSEKKGDEFCGTSAYNACSSDADCVVGGCSGQVCGKAGEGTATTCEYADCYNAQKYGKVCKCYEGKCQWKPLASTAECITEGNSKPVIANPLPCCEGLSLIPPKAENLVGIFGYCTAKCGNGVCDSVESSYNCPADCGNANCTDSDGGRNYFEDGTATAGGQSLSDHCNADGTLTEKYCEDGQIKAETVECPQGYVCSEAACVKGEIQNRILPEPEPLVFAVNKNYADKLPDWKERADRAIDTVNDVFLKTTNKTYKIAKYLVYNDADYEKTWNDPNFYSDFYVKWHDSGATTIILLVHKDGISVDELKQITPSNSVNFASHVFIDDVIYNNIVIANPESYNLLLNKGEMTNYENVLLIVLHELGHTYGLTDWYLNSYIDCTHTEPLLPGYDIREVYPKDPMVAASGTNEYQFNELNSKIINMNLDHRYRFGDHIINWVAKTSKVYATDRNNNPIENAKVEIFCVRKGCFYCNTACNGESGVVDSNIPEQTIYTNNLGYAEYSGASGNYGGVENENTECIAKAIKVYYQGKSNAKYVNFLDLLEDYVLYGKQTHVDHIIIE